LTITELRGKQFCGGVALAQEITDQMSEIEAIFETLPNQEFFEGLEKKTAKTTFFSKY
jgi:hypothetical protein